MPAARAPPLSSTPAIRCRTVIIKWRRERSRAFLNFFPRVTPHSPTRSTWPRPRRMRPATPASPAKSSLPPYYKEVKKASLQVGRGPANAWGLYGMHGNAEEWCLDWYAPYDPSQTTDPVGPIDGDFRVVRGGANSQLARLLRSANRLSMEPWARNPRIGFRVVQADPVAPPTMKALEVPPAADCARARAAQRKGGYGHAVFRGTSPLRQYPPWLRRPALLGATIMMRPLPSSPMATSSFSITPAIPNSATNWPSPRPGCPPAHRPSPRRCCFGNARMRTTMLRDSLSTSLGTIFHFNGNRAMPGSIVRTSTDNGRTWSRARLLNDEIQPSEANIQTADGRILETCDSRFDNSGVVTMSADNGQTWTKLSDDTTKSVFKPGGTGTTIAGIHVGLIERKDGSLWALGRVDKQDAAAIFDYKLPISISTDGGKTWTYSVSEFPDITSGQRLTLKRLKEGPLLLCTFTDDLAYRDADGKVDPSQDRSRDERHALSTTGRHHQNRLRPGRRAFLRRRRHVAGAAPGHPGFSRWSSRCARKAPTAARLPWTPPTPNTTATSRVARVPMAGFISSPAGTIMSSIWRG